MAHDMCRRTVFLGAQKCPQYIIDNVAIPEISAGQVLAKIRLATICGSDVHTMQGKRIEETPSILGHEGVAEIVHDERRNHGNLSPGDRITFSVMDSCGECERCTQGLTQKCAKLFKYGHSSIHVRTGLSGCYASHIVLHEGTRIVKLPENVTDKMAAPINCALATMVNAMGSFEHKRASQKSVLVQGAGLLGIYACALLHDAGFGKIYCSDPKPNRLKMVPLFGGSPIQSGKECEVLQDGEIDIVIEVCGVGSAIALGMRLLKPGGTYILAGLVHPDSLLNVTAESIIRKCLTIKGVHNYSHQHLDEAVAFLSRTASKYPYEQLVGPAFSLNQFESAVQEAIQGRFWRIALNPALME
ncbi:L-threonine 3-dehydrogenase-like [Patiria miniata]|uniref:Alcohol dehydrogenase n=1 Tax=Patiria miniata TaxID=46514 RepID=A0A914B9K4_PATMI|nr:L-threonine 3-dehydrogenase-like [Patiria miniata]